jgi:hypothetical protein
VDDRVRALFFHAGAETDSNLQFVRDMLTKKAFNREAVLKTYGRVRRGETVPDRELDQVTSWLKLSGIVVRRDGRLTVRKAIYEQVFDEPWVREHLRLNVNWRKQLARVGATLLVLTVLVTIPLAVFARRQKVEAERQAVVAQQERDEAMRQRAFAESSLASANASLKTAEDALAALKRVDPASAAAISADVASAQAEARKNMAELTANLRGDRNDVARRAEPPPARTSADRAAANAAPSPPPVSAAPQSTAQQLEVARALRQYEAAYAARSVEALRRIQVLTPAEVQGLRETFANTLQYRLVIDKESIQIAPNGRSATVSARMVRRISKRSGYNEFTDIPEFTLEKRGSTWMIVSVTNVQGAAGGQ